MSTPMAGVEPSPETALPEEPRSLGAILPGLAGALPDTDFSLLELADRLLNKGVVLVGEATISVAGVDLMYLGLNVVLTAVENLLPRVDARRDVPERPATPAESQGLAGERIGHHGDATPA